MQTVPPRQTLSEDLVNCILKDRHAIMSVMIRPRRWNDLANWQKIVNIFWIIAVCLLSSWRYDTNFLKRFSHDCLLLWSFSLSTALVSAN
jgi:hypothetical protein